MLSADSTPISHIGSVMQQATEMQMADKQQVQHTDLPPVCQTGKQDYVHEAMQQDNHTLCFGPNIKCAVC